MKETKHTPGPIFADGLYIRKEGITGAIGQAFLVDFSYDKNGQSLPDKQGEANAKLWAASPELLAALQKAITDYGKPGGPWNVPSQPGTWIFIAKEAVEKALGL
ncbi:MAG: hypothetical protein P4L31_07575 [Candidatus Babeliales bacterium]|nr:hypothetical protein [Candidatus Babeliales bacterium]